MLPFSIYKDLQEKVSFFKQQLNQWYKSHERPMPWKGEKDPYRIWLSEIILQQTRVEQGRPYYLEFIARYSDIFQLAQAEESDILKLWEGLGYYSRARNLLKCAKFLVSQYQGQFPQSAKELQKLPGIGPYTASAISSFAFEEETAVVDGNVIRLISRYFAIFKDSQSSEGKREITKKAQALIYNQKPSMHNQAMLDFGSQICKPKQAQCYKCPLSGACIAFQTDRVYALPVKKKKKRIRNRYFHYFIYLDQDHTYLRKRTNKDIWQGLFDFPCFETEQENELSKSCLVEEGYIGKSQKIKYQSAQKQQQLTHQRIFAFFYIISGRIPAEKMSVNTIKTPLTNLDSFAKPRIVDWFLKENSIYLKNNYIK